VNSHHRVRLLLDFNLLFGHDISPYVRAARFDS